ncbi:MAG: flagellar protein FlgJ [Bermanella sp.]|jgi:flagellar protein FlgJ
MTTTINNTFNYNDLASLNSITKMGRTEEAEALKQVARQFESMFVTMMLKSMRDANAVFEQDNPLNTNESKFYRQMFDDQLALSMSAGKGVGLADSIYRQMKNQLDLDGGDSTGKPDRAIPISDYRGPNPFASMKPNLDLPQFSVEEVPEPINLPIKVPGIQIPAELINRIHNKNDNKINVLPDAAVEPSANTIPTGGLPLSVAPEPTNAKDKVVSQGPVIKQNGFDSPEDFINTIWPIAKKIGEELGVEPKAIISQAALETGWGKYIIHESNGKNSHNLFGIKSDRRWDGAEANVSTLEYRNGVAQKEVASFRSYDSYEHSLKDYANFVKNSSRYEEAVNNGSSIKAYSEGLQQGGYATDPNYAQKIQRIAAGEMLNDIIDNHKSSVPAQAVGRG